MFLSKLQNELGDVLDALLNSLLRFFQSLSRLSKFDHENVRGK